MSIVIVRLASGLVMRVSSIGEMILIQQKSGQGITIPKHLAPLAVQLWRGVPEMELVRLFSGSKRGWIVTLWELGLLERSSFCREGTGTVALPTISPLRSKFFPWAHALIIVWVAVLCAFQFSEATRQPRIGLNQPRVLDWILFAFTPILWIMLHESAHIFVARLAGVKDGYIKLFQAGRFAPRFFIPAWRTYVGYKARYYIYMAGPVMNCIIATSLICASRLYDGWLVVFIATTGVLFACVSILSVHGMDISRAAQCVVESNGKGNIVHQAVIVTTTLVALTSITITLICSVREGSIIVLSIAGA